MQKIEYRCSLAEYTVSSGADCSEQAKIRMVRRIFGMANFIIVPKSKTTCKI